MMGLKVAKNAISNALNAYLRYSVHNVQKEESSLQNVFVRKAITNRINYVSV